MKNSIIVEDIQEVSNWLSQRLVAVFKNTELTSCESLAEANVAINKDSHINLALVDLGLPDGCGTEVIASLRKKSSETYIIVTTIFDDDEHIFSSLQLGANGYLLKDLPADLFENRLRGIMMGHPPRKCSRHKQRASSQSAVKWELKIDRLTRQSLFANFPHHSQTTHTQLLSRSG